MKNVTVVIVTYHTPENIILDCLNSNSSVMLQEITLTSDDTYII